MNRNPINRLTTYDHTNLNLCLNFWDKCSGDLIAFFCNYFGCTITFSYSKLVWSFSFGKKKSVYKFQLVIHNFTSLILTWEHKHYILKLIHWFKSWSSCQVAFSSFTNLEIFSWRHCNLLWSEIYHQTTF